MDKKLEFEIMRRADDSCEFQEFLDALPDQDAAKLITGIRSTEHQGIQAAIRQQWVKKLRDGIFELRSQFGSNAQRALYFHKAGSRYVITHGFTKKTKRTPDREIEKAKRLRDEYDTRKGRR